ncbi:phospholipase, partial [Clostridium perfringens]|nr:phospholipase [Clostridium perfringens]
MMCLRSKIMKKSVIITTCILGLVMTGCSSLTGETKTLESSNVTLVTKVLPYGEVGYAIVCDFGDTVDSSKLNEKSFNVEVDIN